MRPEEDRLLPCKDAAAPSPRHRWVAAAAVAYFMVVSSVATFAVKAMPSVYQFDFPLLLSLCQATVTVVCMAPILAWAWWRSSSGGGLTPLSVLRLAPLALVYVVNLVTGLVGTERLTVPMYIALRRVGILFVVVIERVAYGERHPAASVAAVLVMCAGSGIAAVNDVSFDVAGYAAVTVHNLASAASIVLAKHGAAAELDMPHLLLMNAGLGWPLLACAFAWSDEPARMQQYTPPAHSFFGAAYATACVIGILVTHASFALTRATSALTCSVTGSVKSIALSVLGAVAFADFRYKPYNVVGLAVSMVGALWYTCSAAKAA